MKYHLVTILIMNTILKIISYRHNHHLFQPFQSYSTSTTKHFFDKCNPNTCIYSKKKNCHIVESEDEFYHIDPTISTQTTQTKKERKQKRASKKSQEYAPTISLISPDHSPRKYIPKSHNQQLYAKYLIDPAVKIVVATGAAGTGKTLFACQEAIYQLKQSNIQKIILTRPLVSVDEETLGYLPGTLENKMDPWTRPIFDIFHEYFSKQEVEKMMYNNIIEISPLAYMRGRTFKYSWIIADEMQNSSPNQMLMMTTRLGIGSKLIITGDLQQSDKIPHIHPTHVHPTYTPHTQPTHKTMSGLKDFIDRYTYYKKCQKIHHCEKGLITDMDYMDYMDYTDNLNKNKNKAEDEIEIVYMNTSDIKRSPIVTKILNIYKASHI